MSGDFIQRSVKAILSRWMIVLVLLGMLGGGAINAGAAATNTLVWDKEKGRVTADVRDWPLLELLENIAEQTGWNIFVEPDETFRSSVKFKDLATTQALRRLLGEMNFALQPQTNGPPQLYVFRTAQGNATQQVRQSLTRSAAKPQPIPNELIIRVRPGTDVEALAKSLGAKVIGSIPELDAFRLEFESEEEAEAAREKLLANDDVLSVETNYYVEPPLAPQSLGGMAAPEVKLKLDPSKPDGCNVIVGFVDTAMQSLDPKLEQFVRGRYSLDGKPVTMNTTASSAPTHATTMASAFIQGVQSTGVSEAPIGIAAVDVFGPNAKADTFSVAKGMSVLVNQGKVTMINASLGSPSDSPILRDMVTRISKLGIPVFAAMGNDGSTQPFFPAAYPESVAVTALGRAGQIAPYANRGSTPDLAAPGAVIFSHNGLVYGSQGTSVSSAAAAGVVAGLAGATCTPVTQVIPSAQRVLAVPQ